MMNSTIAGKASQIKLLILDVDGVLTDGKLWFTSEGQEMKSFHVHDGMGMTRLQQAGIPIAIITSRNSPIVSTRMQELGVQQVYQGQKSKSSAFEELLQKFNLTPSAVAYVGDDLPDLPVMQRVGLSVAVANATTPIKQQADWQTKNNGREGAVREVCEMILKSRGLDQ